MTIKERDQKIIWHPFTQHQTARMPTHIVRGERAYLIDSDGNYLLDLISSWWVNLHGHAHPDIADAIYQQAMKLEQVIFSDFTHETAVELADLLLALLPKAFSKVFYSDNGSSAVEVALKMAYQFWRNLGQPARCRFMSFKKGYHGDTFGAMSVGKQSGFFSQFEDLFFSVDSFSYPATWQGDQDVLEKEEMVLLEIETHLEQFSSQTAAMILEPLVQGAGGMQMCRPEFLQQLEKRLRHYGVLIIYDEVMTGFGRTGATFACLKSNTTPDIICLSKGLSGGFLPLAATVCQEYIYQAFLSETFHQALAHSHSFTANPLGCAAAIASMRLLKEPKTVQQMKQIEAVHNARLSEMAEIERIQKQRYCGTIAAFDLTTTDAYGSESSLKWRQIFQNQGLLIRPLGNTIYFLPPYCITADELTSAYQIVINQVLGVTA